METQSWQEWLEDQRNKIQDGTDIVVVIREPIGSWLISTSVESNSVWLAPTLVMPTSSFNPAYLAEFLSGQEFRWVEKSSAKYVTYWRQKELTSPLPNQRWFTFEELREAVQEGKCSAHLLVAYAIAYM